MRSNNIYINQLFQVLFDSSDSHFSTKKSTIKNVEIVDCYFIILETMKEDSALFYFLMI